MKKILAIFLLAGVTFALFPQAAGTEPKDSQPIVVGTDGQQADQGPKTTAVIRTITTKKAYTQTETIPETTTTVVAPDRVLVREGVLSWVSVGIRVSADYHAQQSDGRLSPLWLYGEFYNTLWGVELGVGRLSQPLTATAGFSANGSAITVAAGSRDYWTVESIFKLYMPFAKWFWAGAGLAFNSYDSGIVYSAPSNAAATNNYANLVFMKSQLLWEGGLGIKVALTNGFNAVHFDPNIRVLGPINNDGNMSVVVRLNLGFTYSFGL